MYDSAGSIPWS